MTSKWRKEFVTCQLPHVSSLAQHISDVTMNRHWERELAMAIAKQMSSVDMWYDVEFWIGVEPRIEFMTNLCQCNGSRIFLVSKQNTYKNVSVVNCPTSCNPTLRNLSTQLIMSQSIHLHAYSNRARLLESVVYKYNWHINKLRAWAWYVIKNSPFDHNLTSIIAGHWLQ